LAVMVITHKCTDASHRVMKWQSQRYLSLFIQWHKRPTQDKLKSLTRDQKRIIYKNTLDNEIRGN